MSLGILGGSIGEQRRALGGEPPPDPWCWKSAGYPWGAAFDACHAQNWKTCDGKRYEDKLQNKIWTTPQFDDCVYTLDNTRCTCPGVKPTAAPASSAAAASTAPKLTMGNKTSDPRVIELQRAINEALSGKGYAAIGTDGKLGPGTCGAAREADKFGAGLMQKYGLASVCTSFTTPVKSGASSFSPAPSSSGPTSLEPVSTQAGFLGMDNNTLLLVAAGIGAAFFMMKKKKKAA